MDEKQNVNLKADNFLSTLQYPKIHFNSTGGCVQSSGKIWELRGDLTLKEKTSPLTMIVNFSYINEEKKRVTALFHLFGSVSRKNYGLLCADEVNTDDEVKLSTQIF